MKHAAEPDVVGTLGIFEKTCGYCGAHFRVLAAQVPDENHAHGYACPDCGKEYSMDAVEEPEVLLLRRRSDGKDDRYQETMF
jgi:DNA-directed RNA polymerase subunit RPC12/RpoP